MDSKALALETCSLYLAHVDNSISHSANVTAQLKPLVFELTQRIIREAIRDDDRVSVGDAKFNSSANISHSAINFIDSNFINNGNKTDAPEIRDGLISRRSLARFEAFVEGVSLAVPSDPITLSRSPINRPPPNLLDLSVALPALTSRLGNLGAIIEGKKAAGVKVSESASSIYSDSDTISGAGSVSSNAESSHSHRRPRRYIYRQVDPDDLSIRLELYVRSLKRVFQGPTAGTTAETPTNGAAHLFEECNAHREPFGLLRARVDCISRAFIANVSCVTSIQPVLTALLGALTRELLAVEMLGEDLLRVMKRVSEEYEMQTSFASIAFLSSPEQSAGSVLSPLVMSYLKFLRLDWRRLVFVCELEGILSAALSFELRHTFKSTAFASIGHLLEVCHRFKHVLEHIELPPLRRDSSAMFAGDDPKIIKQALQDLRRETITVNGNILPPARSRKQLIRLLCEALNSNVASWETSCNEDEKLAEKSVPVITNDETGINRCGSTSASDSELTPDAISDNEAYLSSDDSLGSPIRSRKVISSIGSLMKNRTNMTRRSKRFDLRTIDKVTLRLMVASCRTGTGGDAFFVVQDLFGGDGVVVVPSASLTSPSPTKSPSSDDSAKRKRQGTIEITVLLSSVVIKVHGRYNVFPKNVQEDCEPLIQLRTTTTETISLRTVRVRDADGACLDVFNEDAKEASTLVLQERVTETTGKRILSVQPARYRKVEVWSSATPS